LSSGTDWISFASGMTASTLIKTALVQKVRLTADRLIVDFDDGRSLTLPLAW